MEQLNKKIVKQSEYHLVEITQEMKCRFWEYNLNPITGWRPLKKHKRALEIDVKKYAKVLKPMPAFKSLIV